MPPNDTPKSTSHRLKRIHRWIGIGLTLAALNGCASYGVIENEPITEASRARAPYSLKTWAAADRSSDVIFILAFSGGGTRASAMAYGVLEELRDTNVVINGNQERLLDEVDYISSVSGGSFTAAYYGLYGEKLFSDFEDDFLRANVEGHLTRSLFNPFHWFGSKGRTQRAIEYYQRHLFDNATFADMQKPDRPMIIINASDLAEGVRFSFIQDYFNFLGSDLSTFPVARAVAGSSAVPVVLNPVVVENFPAPAGDDFRWPANAETLAKQDAYFRMLYTGLQSYSDKETRKYIHFVDGGITDNTGLRAMSDIMEISGGPQAMLSGTQRKIPKHVVILSVNASTEKASVLDESNKEPSVLTAMNATTNVQLHRYNADSIELAKNELYAWAAKMSTSGQKVTPHFIEIDFADVPQPQMRLFLNKIPTSFNLTDEQVDALINNGRSILRGNPEYRKFLKEIR